MGTEWKRRQIVLSPSRITPDAVVGFKYLIIFLSLFFQEVGRAEPANA